MGVAEIIKELPKLSVEERSTVLQRLRELEEQDGLQFLHEAAEAVFEETDKQEAKNAQGQPR